MNIKPEENSALEKWRNWLYYKAKQAPFACVFGDSEDARFACLTYLVSESASGGHAPLRVCHVKRAAENF